MTPTVDKSKTYQSGGADQFLDFIETEVITYVEKNYRTANYRTLAGHSLGGLAVTQSFIRSPGKFNAYFFFSGSYTRNNGEHLKRFEQSLKQQKDSSAFFI